jgi:hypothetical protein
MELAIRTSKMVNDIKGETPFGILPKFDYVKASVPEYMHGDCLGVCKQFFKQFFTCKKSQEERVRIQVYWRSNSYSKCSSQ